MILILVTAVAAGVGALRYATQTQPAKLSAEILEMDRITFRYSGADGQGVSPVCGCGAVATRTNWRGVSFAARETVVQAQSAKATTLYRLTSPEQEETAWFSPGAVYYADVVQASVDNSDNFDPRSVLRRKADSRTVRTLQRRRVFEANLNFITDEPLHVSQLGGTPLASWLPARGSTISLGDSSAPTPYPQDKTTGRSLLERFPARVKDADRKLFPYLDAYPAGDFLGPDLVIWAADSDAEIGAGGFRYTTGQRAPRDREIITAVIIRRPPFATRIGVMPFSRSAVRNQRKLWRDGRNRRHNYLGLIDNPTQSGAVSVSFPKGALSAREYRRLYERIKRKPWTTRDSGPPPPGRKGNDYVVTYRLPPLRRESAFTIWGDLGRLELEEAAGAVQIEDSALAIPTPSAVELTRMSGYAPTAGAGLPVALESGSSESGLRFKATAALSLNGTDKTRRADRVSNIALISLLMSVVGFVLGVGGAILKVTESAKST